MRSVTRRERDTTPTRHLDGRASGGQAPERSFRARKRCNHTPAVSACRERRVSVEAKARASRDALLDIDAVDPWTRSVRFAGEIEERLRIHEDGVADLRVMV